MQALVPEEKLQSLDTQKLTAYDRKILEDLVEILTHQMLSTTPTPTDI